jgi:hypothetical protein
MTAGDGTATFSNRSACESRSIRSHLRTSLRSWALTGWELLDLRAESFPLVFSGADEWWAWAWSHGYRQILESMGAVQIHRYRKEAFGHYRRTGSRFLVGLR